MSVELDRLYEAAGFLPPEIRLALARTPDGSLCRSLPPRRVALLWCDISGFTRHTNTLLATRQDGVEELHRQLKEHYCEMITMIVEFGGEPAVFVGDGLLSTWPAEGPDMSDAVVGAVAAANALRDRCCNGGTLFDMNLNVACGELQTVELGGRHNQWLSTSLGSAIRELRGIASCRAPNDVILTRNVARLCPPDALTEEIADGLALRLMHFPYVKPIRAAALPLPSEEAWAAVISRVPRYIASWIETVGLEWLAELRPVTALTIALHDFDQSAEDAGDRLGTIVQTIQEITQGFDGSLANVLVDEKGASLLVTFGTPPDAHSDDPLRSVLTGKEIARALAQMKVRASAGVATARAFCGIVGTPQHRSLLILSDGINTSSRLAWATADGILVDAPTMRATRATAGYDAQPQTFWLKGQDEAVQAWALTGEAIGDEEGPRVAGRSAEIGMLLRLWATGGEGEEGTGVIVEGESGSGKTTLARALRNDIENAGGCFRIETASSIERETPYGALRRVIGEAVGVTSGMTLSERREAVLNNLSHDLHELAPLLDAVFPTGLEETALTAELIGRLRTQAIEDLLVRLLTDAFTRNPTFLCVDDAQWLDPGSRQILVRLLPGLPELIVVILVQQVGDLEWLDDLVAAGLHRIRLAALKRDGMAALICLRLGCTSVSEKLLDQITEATGGHPFFTSELIISLKAAGYVMVSDGVATPLHADESDTMVVPDTLHGMVLQRFDRQEPAVQLSLRVAAVAGLAFPTKLVCAIHPLRLESKEINRHLTGLFKMDFLEPMAVGDRPGYGFSHSIMREVAYNQLPYLQRRVLHADAAEWLEANSGADRANKLMEIAHHWLAAERQEKAVACMLEEALRLFGQGFAVEAVQVGIRAIRLSGVEVPADPATLQAEVGEIVASLDEMTRDRQPTELLAGLGDDNSNVALKLTALLSTAPFAFQSNQFATFAWASATAMKLALAHSSASPHAFSMYSIVKSAISGDRTSGAAWSRAALDLDMARDGAALPVVGFIDTWFHGHWRDPLHMNAVRNRAAAARALEDGDRQYASYNIAGEVVMRAASGERLETVITASEKALGHQLHRNARVHVTMECQFARALQGATTGPVSLSSDDIDEDRDIGWVMQSEFINQIGYYLATRIRLHRHGGDWSRALELAAELEQIRPAVAGQTAEFDAVFHTVLARLGLELENGTAAGSQTTAVDHEIAQLSEWRNIHPGNFGSKAEIAEAVRDGLAGDRDAAAERLVATAGALGPDYDLQDRALALEYAARLKPGGPYKSAALKAYVFWGADAVALRLSRTLR
ncbi:AAA family ATPase [Aquicoccus sp.]|uniref:AAA family ATPase n=1 Tax=Aquicoccus sp. TaxID=2055851 RepID=UPI00356A51B6